VSRGPDLVEVPDLSGERLANAVETLKAAGFVVDVRSEFPEEDWNKPYARVASTDPGEGRAKRGSTIIVRGVL
jgi:serine/threonine-protein kinase